MIVNINVSMNVILNSSSRKPISLSVSVHREFRSICGCAAQTLFPNSVCKCALIVTHSDAVVLILSLWTFRHCRKLTGHLSAVSEMEAILSREIKLGSIPCCFHGGWSLFPHCRGLFIEGEGRAATNMVCQRRESSLVVTQPVACACALGGARNCCSKATSDISIRHRVMNLPGPGEYRRAMAVSLPVCFSCKGHIT